jgi:hypothetical protein
VRPEYAEIFMPPARHVAGSRRFAFAVIEPASSSPGFLLRRAFEERGGNPYIGLAASDYGALMVLFPSPESREEAMLLFPINFDGHSIRLERPEDGHNRFSWRFSYFAQLSATGFPIEHWDEGGIRTAFRSIGSVCCIDPLCLNELDYSAVRLVIKLENDMDVPHALLVRDFDGSSGTEVRIRVVRVWSCDEDGSSVSSAHFDDLGGAGLGPSPGRGQPAPRMSDIDSDSLPGDPRPEPRDGPQSELMDLWRRVVDRRRADISATLSSIRSPLTSGPVQAPPRSSPTELWDRVLARRLAAQFLEEGLDADQVRLPIPTPPLVFPLAAILRQSHFCCSGTTPSAPRRRPWFLLRRTPTLLPTLSRPLTMLLF